MIAYIVEGTRASREVDLEEGPKREVQLFGRVLTAKEAAERASAFFAKLQPVFSVR